MEAISVSAEMSLIAAVSGLAIAETLEAAGVSAIAEASEVVTASETGA